MSKILYFRVWPHHPIDQTVPRVLADALPEFQIDIVTLADVIKSRPCILLVNALITLWQYGLETLRGRKKLREAFWRTTFIFRWVKRWASNYAANSPGDYAFSFQFQSLFDTRVPGLTHFVYTDHTHLENLNYPGFDVAKLYPARWLALETQVYRNADRVFSRSDNITRSLIEQYDCAAEKIACVYGGANVRVEPGDLENDDYRNKRILFVGADWERKGGPDLLQAFAIVLKEVPDAQLVIVGVSPDTNIQNCTVVGRIPAEELPRYFKQASIFCLPTHLEPFGVVVIEAMTYKLPVVTTRIGAFTERVEEGKSGFLVEPGDVDAIAKSLIALLKDPQLCKAFGERGYNTMMDRFNWENTAKLLRENILSLIK